MELDSAKQALEYLAELELANDALDQDRLAEKTKKKALKRQLAAMKLELDELKTSTEMRDAGSGSLVLERAERQQALDTQQEAPESPMQVLEHQLTAAAARGAASPKAAMHAIAAASLATESAAAVVAEVAAANLAAESRMQHGVNVSEMPARDEEEVFECDHCGEFHGSFEVVQLHEQSCYSAPHSARRKEVSDMDESGVCSKLRMLTTKR